MSDRSEGDSVTGEERTQPASIAGQQPAVTSPANECYSCADPDTPGSMDGAPRNECLKSPKPCGHHCNHSWTHDHCDFCGKEWGEE